MKILNVVKTNEGAGWAFRQAEWIINNHSDIEIVAVLPNENGGFADKYRELGCKVIGYDMSLPITHPWEFFKKKKQIKQIVKDEKPDIIHSHFVTTTLMIRLALRKDPTRRIFQVPGPLHLESFFFKAIDKLTIQKKDFLVGACEWTCTTYRKMGVPEDRVFLNYYGGGGKKLDIDLNSTLLRDTFGISHDVPLVGMVSYFYAPKYYLLQFRGIKGHEDFIKAMSMVRESIPDAVGIVIGSAWGKKAVKYESRVKKYAERVCPGGIIFAGFRDDVPYIYHELNVAVHPSHSENVGGAGESQSLAVPTVSTNVGGFPDAVINGKTGWTVNKKSPKELADRIVWMLTHREEGKQMAVAGKEIVTAKFNIKVTGQYMFDIYQTVTKYEVK